MGKKIQCHRVDAGVRDNEIVDHVVRNATTTGTIHMDRTDILKSVTQELMREEEKAHGDNIYLQKMKDIDVRTGGGGEEERVGGWYNSRLTGPKLTGTVSAHTLPWLLKQREGHVWVFPECDDANSYI